jgi:hypothetical protein
MSISRRSQRKKKALLTQQIVKLAAPNTKRHLFQAVAVSPAAAASPKCKLQTAQHAIYAAALHLRYPWFEVSHMSNRCVELLHKDGLRSLLDGVAYGSHVPFGRCCVCFLWGRKRPSGLGLLCDWGILSFRFLNQSGQLSQGSLGSAIRVLGILRSLS